MRSPEFVPYKFCDLKVYSSTEWLANNQKKYRQVFDRFLTTYIYAEFSFYNKLFDQEDWSIDVNLKCFSTHKGLEEVCNLDLTKKISKYDHIVYLREGWGNKTVGSFWKEGTYYWEIRIDGQKVASKYFYVEDSKGSPSQEGQPFFSIQSIKLYEGSYDDCPIQDRIYFREFDVETTRYIYAEILLKNLRVDIPWQMELYVKFFNESRELKGNVIRLQRLEKDTETIDITAGWGSNVKGSWRNGNYTCEIIFLNKVIAIIPFQIGDAYIEGINTPLLASGNQLQLAPELIVSHESFEDVMQELDQLIGLHDIKKRIREHAQYIQYLKLRKERGLEGTDEIEVHSVFIGNPGTGKTTVASMMGRLYKEMGLLTQGHVHLVDRVDLIGEYIGQTAPKVKEAIEKARGGVLFIDEAYSLARANDDTKDFGREAIEILMKEMSNGSGDLAVVVAGYPKEMEEFLNSNPGLRSRFKLYFDFADYLPQELSQIADFVSTRKGVHFDSAAKSRLEEIIIESYRNRTRSFGNARFVEDLIRQAKIFLGLRVMQTDDTSMLSEDDLSTILLEDVNKIEVKRTQALPDIPVDDKLLTQALAELDALIGMTQIKQEINELVRLVKYYRSTGRDVLNKFSLHTVFVGNPGTGKTTVARILTQIYKALGVLERGHMVETDRHGLVAGFVGQTAIKTAEKVDESLGGVLFIDEAYALNGNGNGDYGNEAIQTILKRMEDHRGEFFVFVAGYPKNMDDFLKANPGLKSRFDKVLRFEDYQPQELFSIAEHMLQTEGISATPEARELILAHLNKLYNTRDQFFGNARTVRNVIGGAIKNLNLRLSSLDDAEREGVNIDLLTADDVKIVDGGADTYTFEKPLIGFRKNGNTK